MTSFPPSSSSSYQCGTQAAILDNVVSSLPKGEASAEADTTSLSTPEEMWSLSKRQLCQAKQISQVMLNFVDKTVTQFREIEIEYSGNQAILVEGTLQRFSAFKELIAKNASLQTSAMEALDKMSSPLSMTSLSPKDLLQAQKGWMTMDQIKKLVNAATTAAGSNGSTATNVTLPTAAVVIDPAQVEAHKVISIENRKLKLKVDALQKQVELLSSTQHHQNQHLPIFSPSQSQSSSAFDAAAPASPPRHQSYQQQSSSSSPPPPPQQQQHQTVLNDAQAQKEINRLRTIVEEQEELLRGLRTTLRDVCSDKYPILAERDELRQKVQSALQAQVHLLEDGEALEVRCAQVEGQLQRTVQRCRMLEAMVGELGQRLVVASSSPSPSTTLAAEGGGGGASVSSASMLEGAGEKTDDDNNIGSPTTPDVSSTVRLQQHQLLLQQQRHQQGIERETVGHPASSANIDLLVSSPLLEATSGTIFHVPPVRREPRVEEEEGGGFVNGGIHHRGKIRRFPSDFYDDEEEEEGEGGVLRSFLVWMLGGTRAREQERGKGPMLVV